MSKAVKSKKPAVAAKPNNNRKLIWLESERHKLDQVCCMSTSRLYDLAKTLNAARSTDLIKDCTFVRRMAELIMSVSAELERVRCGKSSDPKYFRLD
jgi:hypothetical protein